MNKNEFVILDLSEVKYSDTCKNKITIRINKDDDKHMNEVSLIGSFFHYFERMPNNKDMMLVNGDKRRRSIRVYLQNDMFDAIDEAMDVFESSYSEHPNAIKECVGCGEYFTRHYSGDENCCSYKCKKISSVNICVICHRNFIGEDGYSNICPNCENNRPLDSSVVSKTQGSYKTKKSQIKMLVEEKITSLFVQSQQESNKDTFGGSYIDYRKVGGFTNSIKSKVRERDSYQCQICGCDTNLHIHHIVPRKEGGNHNLDNLILVCSKCHMYIETNTVERAIEKCTKNALMHGGVFESNIGDTNDAQKVAILTNLLIDTFNGLSNDNDKEDILSYISDQMSEIL